MPSKRSNPKQKPDALPQPVYAWSFEAIGTQWWVGLFESCDGSTVTRLQQVVEERIRVFDKTYSRFRSDSLVARIAQQAGKYVLPPDAQALFDLYRKLYDLTEGKVTPLVGQLLSDAGYDADYSLQTKELHALPAWDDVMTFENGILITQEPLLLDFGAAGKGYLVDLIAKELQKAGIKSFCVDGSGDMVCRGLDGPLHIGLENPDDTSQAVGVAELRDGALCGSAGNRRAWAEFTHIMDPNTLSSPKHIKAVWVCAADALTADGLTTALYFADAAILRSTFEFEHCMIYADGTVSVSQDFPAEIFTKLNTQNA